MRLYLLNSNHDPHPMEMETIVHPFGLLALTSERVKTIGLSVSSPQAKKREGVCSVSECAALIWSHSFLWELQNRLELRMNRVPETWVSGFGSTFLSTFLWKISHTGLEILTKNDVVFRVKFNGIIRIFGIFSFLSLFFPCILNDFSKWSSAEGAVKLWKIIKYLAKKWIKALLNLS